MNLVRYKFADGTVTTTCAEAEALRAEKGEYRKIYEYRDIPAEKDTQLKDEHPERFRTPNGLVTTAHIQKQ